MKRQLRFRAATPLLCGVVAFVVVASTVASASADGFFLSTRGFSIGVSSNTAPARGPIVYDVAPPRVGTALPSPPPPRTHYNPVPPPPRATVVDPPPRHVPYDPRWRGPAYAPRPGGPRPPYYGGLTPMPGGPRPIYGGLTPMPGEYRPGGPYPGGPRF